MGRENDDDLFISALTIGEIWRGILEAPVGKKRANLERWFEGPEGPAALFAGRILPFDASAAIIWARLMAAGKAAGRPRSAMDMIIASVGEVHNCIVVTDNIRDFEGIETLNPVRG